jgi:hypothetical protein
VSEEGCRDDSRLRGLEEFDVMVGRGVTEREAGPDSNAKVANGLESVLCVATILF